MHVEHIDLQESLERISTAARTGWSLAGPSPSSVSGDEGDVDASGPMEGSHQSISVNRVRLMDGLRLEPGRDSKRESGESGGVS